ncbi:MAG: acyl-CoA dehydrogenase [Planctomycetes bacterium]|nr:acyl-CoA dehydrogenase [Planctomycetota bacterium]
MNFDLTEDQQILRNMVREFALKEVEPRSAAIDRDSAFPRDLFHRMAELGLMGIPYPEEYGGAGADVLSYAITVEEISRVCGSTGLSLAAHCSLGTYPIYGHGTEEQKRRYLPALCAGKTFGSFGLTEPNAGSDAGGTQTTARRDGDTFVVNGTKIFITNVNHADTFVITAKTDLQASGSRGISALILERGLPGFKVNKGDEKLGTRGSDWGELVFEDVRVPAQNLLGELHQGFKVFMDTLDGGRISIGAMALGIAQGALDKSIEYARSRRQFGAPIGSHQAIAFMIADMATEIEAARHLVYHAARLKDAHRPFGRESAMAKLYASETAMRCSDRAIQIHGGYGYLRDFPVERYYRDAQLTTIGEGTSEIQRLVISRAVLGRL